MAGRPMNKLHQADVRKKIQAAIFYYLLRPLMNRCVEDDIVACPMCGELLAKYEDKGFLHMADGDADCFGVLSKGKGYFK